jgi:hypothetical protein
MQSSSDLIQRLEMLMFFAFKNQAVLSIFSPLITYQFIEDMQFSAMISWALQCQWLISLTHSRTEFCSFPKLHDVTAHILFLM